MEKRPSLKSVVIIISLAIVAIIVLAFVALAIASKKPVAAFYGISEANQKNIVSVLQTTYTRRNKKSLPYEIITLNSEASLKKALKESKKPDLLFIYGGMNADYATLQVAKKHGGFAKDILQGMTTSVRMAAPVSGGKITAVPLLIDHYEIDVNRAKFDSASISEINLLSDLEEFARLTQASTMAPMVFAAGDDVMLINAFAALTEAVSGRGAVDSVAEKVRLSIASGKSSQTAFYNILLDVTANGGEWYESTQLFKKWIQMNLLPRNIFQMKLKDVRAFMESDLTAVSMLTLSEHRATPRNTVSKYSSSFIPGTTTDGNRNFTAPIIYAIPLKKGKIPAASVALLANSLQTSLSNATGLAPVQANCGVPDIQSDDVRYWVAASGVPMVPFSEAAFTNKPNRTSFAEALRSILR